MFSAPLMSIMLPGMGYACHSLEILDDFAEYDWCLLKLMFHNLKCTHIPLCDRRRGLKVMFISLIKLNVLCSDTVMVDVVTTLLSFSYNHSTVTGTSHQTVHARVKQLKTLHLSSMILNSYSISLTIKLKLFATILPLAVKAIHVNFLSFQDKSLHDFFSYQYNECYDHLNVYQFLIPPSPLCTNPVLCDAFCPSPSACDVTWKTNIYNSVLAFEY